MNAQEFKDAVANLLGQPFVEEHPLSHVLEHPKMTIHLKEKFLGGFSVYVFHSYSEMVQPDQEELADAFDRISYTLDRINADWSSYENYANQALEEFKTHCKMQVVYTPCINHFLPGYRVTAPGLPDLVLATIGVGYRGYNYVAIGKERNNGVSINAYFGPEISSGLQPGTYAIRCTEKDGTLSLWSLHENNRELARIFKERNVETRIRRFTVNRALDDSDPLAFILPDCEKYEKLLGAIHYTFVEFDVYR